MIRQVSATSVLQVLKSGSTNPILVLCEDEGFEVVLKPLTALRWGTLGRASEVLGAFLAKDLRLAVAEPLLVNVTSELVHSLEPNSHARQVLEKNVGLNFGSKWISPSAPTWPTSLNRGRPTDFTAVATQIFSFDVVIQNHDRKADNPNVLYSLSKKELVLFDHERAFSLLRDGNDDVGLDDLKFDLFYQHVFCYGISRGPWFGEFFARLGEVSESRLASYREAIPEEWRSTCDSTDRILKYIRWVRDSREAISAQIETRFLL